MSLHYREERVHTPSIVDNKGEQQQPVITRYGTPVDRRHLPNAHTSLAIDIALPMKSLSNDDRGLGLIWRDALHCCAVVS